MCPKKSDGEKIFKIRSVFTKLTIELGVLYFLGALYVRKKTDKYIKILIQEQTNNNKNTGVCYRALFFAFSFALYR